MVDLSGAQIGLAITSILCVGLLISTITVSVLYSQEEKCHDTTPVKPPTFKPPQTKDRINCFPELEEVNTHDVTMEECLQRGCQFEDTYGNLKAPLCYMHPEQTGYFARTHCKNCFGYVAYAELEVINKTSVIFDPSIERLKFFVYMISANQLHFEIVDATSDRWRVPKFRRTPCSSCSSSEFTVEMNASPFSFKVTRTSTGATFFDSSLGGLVFSDRFLQISTKLATTNFYGLGEHEHPDLKHSLEYKTWPMFARDQPGLGVGYPLYGVHPMYMVVEEDRKAHGVFLLNSNAIEYTLLPSPAAVIRTIGGILEFNIYLGPTPEDIVKQHTEYVGRPTFPPYWAMGFHLARWGYNNLSNMEAAIDRTRLAGIPLDVIYADIDHLDRKQDFTIDEVNFPNLKGFLTDQKSSYGLRSVIILDPALPKDVQPDYPPYKELEDADVFLKWPNGTILMGYVWPPGKVSFPDFLNDKTADPWKSLIVRHHADELPFDGVWIDMNEPANFDTNDEKPWNWPEDQPAWSLKCADSYFDSPPYRTRAISIYDGHYDNGRPGKMSDKSICMETTGILESSAVTTKQYDTHNLYGWSESGPTVRAMESAIPGKRTFVLSRSTFPGSGSWVSHWLGDNVASWEHLRHSIIGMLEMSWFGFAHTGPDICGFLDTPSPQLCKRWMQLGAFYPFSRNHNVDGTPDQDPGAMGPEVAEASKKYMRIRYDHLPYLYTLMNRAHTDGSTVARPLFHEFITDSETLSIDSTFMLGKGLLVAPILVEDETSASVYLPRGKWRNIVDPSSTPIDHCAQGAKVDIMDTAAFHRGGVILPMQVVPADQEDVSTANTKSLPLSLDIFFDCDGVAAGELFWDDGESTLNANYYQVSYSATKTATNVSLSATVGVRPDPYISDLDIDYGELRFRGVVATNPSPIGCTRCDVTYDSATELITLKYTGRQPLSNTFTQTVTL